MPASIGMRWHPNSPKSWKYGNHVTSLSSDVPPSMARRARMFAMRLRCVRRAPLGIPVLPEENWSTAESSCCGM